MIIYRIYKIDVISEYDGYLDDYTDIEKDITIKYVDSLDKVNKFMDNIKQSNKACEKCIHCPIVSLTKRKYNLHKNEVNSYCKDKDLVFEHNSVFCLAEKHADYTEYFYETITVE